MRDTTTRSLPLSRLTTVLTLALAAAAGCGDDDDQPPPTPELIYELTIENLTTSQPFSPGVVITNTGAPDPLFTVGGRASPGLRLLAEVGDPSLVATERAGRAGVQQTITLQEPTHRILGPGATSQTMRVTVSSDHGGVLALAVMLICTNDGFAAVDNVRLPLEFEAVTVDLLAYDAGSEINDERFASIPDACQMLGPTVVPADGDLHNQEAVPIAPHAGILGVGDLQPFLYGWRDPVGRVTIKRIQ